ncbi:hypothetical protein TNCV_4502011 [Trichonephila clavipes]|nr:hypothetical protein TNCV_4502011 [Trichonephila clavipes]
MMLFVSEENKSSICESFQPSPLSALSRVFGMIGDGYFILELYPVCGWSEEGEVPRDVKGCRGMPKTRSCNILTVQVFIERGDHIHKEKPFYRCVTGNVTPPLT